MSFSITNAPGPRAGVRKPRGSGAADVRAPRPLEGEGPRRADYTVHLPPTPLLNANQRIHWTQRYPIASDIRRIAGWAAKAAKVPRLPRVHVMCEVRFPDRQRRDVGNWAPSAKAAVDGLVDAGVLKDDSDEYMTGPDMRLGPIERGMVPRGYGRLVLHITDISLDNHREGVG